MTLPESKTPNRRRVLFASLTAGRDQCSIGNALSGVKAQMSLLRLPVHLEFRFERDLGSALDHFFLHPEFDALVAVDNLISYTDAWVIENALGHDDKPIVVATYPLPGEVDWDRVRAKAADAGEPNHAKGNVYNVVIDEHASFTPDGRFLIVDRARLDCVVIKREAIADIAARHPELVHAGGILAHCERLRDGKKLTRDEAFCDLWGKPIYADLEHPASSFGTQVFAGVVGLRTRLR